ncbi:hypothetical protein EU538_09995 [Candidatus Thorarchaeota archaeon]|jgi:hypothetical protein|nr:MAG: hypothetical protein EU538_09995 [Candidatus Thorarchaeota archaeon]
MTVIEGIIREVGKSTTTRISARRWYGSTTIVVQEEDSGKTYSVRISSNTMKKCNFLPRVGMEIVVHGYIEEAERGLSDYYVSRVTHVKHKGSGVKRTVRFDE